MTKILESMVGAREQGITMATRGHVVMENGTLR